MGIDLSGSSEAQRPMNAQPKDISAKERIVHVALELFAARGFDNVGVTEIAEAAGVSQPSIHYHFKNKRGLWEAAMMALAIEAQETASMQESVFRSLDLLSALKAACALLIERSQKAPDLGRVILSEGQTGGERLDWLMRNVFADSYYNFLELIEANIDAGHIKPFKPFQILMLLHGAAVTNFNVAPLVDAVFGENVHAPDNVASFQKMYLDVMFAGLAPRPTKKVRK